MSMTADLERLSLGDNAPHVVNVVVEVPVGSRNKYEYDPELGVIMRDRVLPGSVRYPLDYGFLPLTAGDDGRPLDVLLAAYDPVFPGCVVRGRPIGVLIMQDANGPDQKIFAVPDDDPRFTDIKTITDIPEQNLREIEQFLQVYKQLEGDQDVEIGDWLGRDEAHELIRKAARP
jgi:inorganic pyrophosphatase